MSGVDPATIVRTTNIQMVSGSVASLDDPSKIILSRNVARAHDWQAGDTISVLFNKSGRQTFTIGGVYETNEFLNDYAISLDAYDRNFTGLLDSIVFVTAADAVPIERARTAIAAVARNYPNVEIHNQAQFKQQSIDQVNQILVLVFVLLLLAIIISLFGIVNTLSLSIYERVHEIGLLRAVGMSRVQVRRMIRVEAVIIAVLGAVLGIVIGLVFGWVMQRSLSDVGIDRFAVPYGQLVVFIVASAILGVGAAVFPARRAARLDVLAAIAYE
jgi:putative ABC transport system permease protein